MNCPKCHSSRVSTNRIEIIPDHAVPHGVQTARHTGHPGIGIALMTLWGLTKGINALRHEYRCDHCDHRFSAK